MLAGFVARPGLATEQHVGAALPTLFMGRAIARVRPDRLVSLLSRKIIVVGVGRINNACSSRSCDGTAGSWINAVVGHVDRDLLRCHNTWC